ncbi:MAG: exo-alpha-sialidase [Acidobacteriaceae bacterium]|nr:exo-alpha-sialidase [Acidobacteriaceae bacterium]
MLPLRLPLRLALGLSLLAPLAPAAPRLLSVERIWGEAPHSAFGDLIRFDGRWFATFREGIRHVAGGDLKKDDGKIRILSSPDGKRWRSEALVEESGIDLRDPHLSLTPQGRLMLTMGGSVYVDAQYRGRQPRVAFSKDGKSWTPPRRVLREGDWLWRTTWHDGWGWGIAKYGAYGKPEPGNPRRVDLVRSRDGVTWEKVLELGVPGGDEATIRFRPDGTMLVLMRRGIGEGDTAMLGEARPPYRDWVWTDTKLFVGGPNFLILPDGALWGGGRHFRNPGRKDPVTVLARMTTRSYEPVLTLPSGNDSSYPGFVWHDGLLWMTYYSSHEGKTAIYLAKIALQP